MLSFYNTGTVSVANGATTVTGTGVLWSGLLAGDTLELAGQRVTIASVTDATHFELATPWSGTTQSGASYLVRFDAPSRFTSGYLAEQVRALIAQAGIIKAARPNYEVQSLGGNAPPGAPVTGDMYVVGTVPTGAWSAMANNLAQWAGSAWLFTAPSRGTTVVSVATGIVSIWSGAAWLPYKAPTPYIETLMDDINDARGARHALGGTAFQALGTLNGAAGSFPRFTGPGGADAVMQEIVGTVSQSGGVPTGAIVGSGSNGNGLWTRWADGTQICERRHASVSGIIAANNYVSLGAHTFPAAFSRSAGCRELHMTAGGRCLSPRRYRPYPPLGISGAYFSNLSSVNRDTSAADAVFHYIAKGRWF